MRQNAPAGGEIIRYQHSEAPAVDALLVGDTVWLSPNQIAALLVRDNSTISQHISYVFAEGELERHAHVQGIRMSPAQSFYVQRSGVAESIAPLGAWRHGPCDFAQGDGDFGR